MDASMIVIARLIHDTVEPGDVFNTMTLFADLNISVADAERRMRDLATLGWVIHSHNDDHTVQYGTRRLVTVGNHIWEPGVTRKLNSNKLTTRTQAQEVSLSEFSIEQLRTIRRWMIAEHREPTPEEQLWELFRRGKARTKRVMHTRLMAELLQRMDD